MGCSIHKIQHVHPESRMKYDLLSSYIDVMMWHTMIELGFRTFFFRKKIHQWSCRISQ